MIQVRLSQLRFLSSSMLMIFTFLALLMTPSSALSAAQDADPANTVTVYVESAGIASDIEVINAFFQAVQEALIPYELRVSVTHDPERADGAVVDLYSPTLSGGALVMLNRQQPVFELSQSPLLRETFGMPYRLPAFSTSTDGTDTANTAAVNLVVGTILYQLGDCEAAFSVFDSIDLSIFETREYQGVMNFYRAVCALRAGDLPQAEAHLNAGYNGVPNGMVNAAWLHLQYNRDAEAFALLDAYVAGMSLLYPSETDNGEADAYALRAQFHALNFDYDAAIADVNRALDVLRHENFYPPPPMEYLADFYVLRGQMVLLTYEWDQVAADYTFAMHLAPDYAPPYYYRGILFYTQGPKTAALEDFRRYLELTPDGEFTESAAKYVESIEVELEALGE